MRNLLYLALGVGLCAYGQRGGGGGGIPTAPVTSLKSVAPPVGEGVERYVADQGALVVLGKALFWDMQTGSDGRTACATCHFHAGADHRKQHQLSGGEAAVNRLLTADDFPFRKLSDPNSNRSSVVSDRRQTTGSMGVVAREFVQVEPGKDTEVSNAVSFPSPFQPGGVHLRQVTGRNAGSVINAVYNVRNFWDGRASNVFTGATPFGGADPGMHALAYREGKWEREAVRVENASLASQAVGPILNSVEMSWAGRRWPDLGRKLLGLAPLARQKVSAADSVFGELANPEGNGLLPQWTYAALVRAAFRPEYHQSPDLFEGYSQAENNFALFWGLAIQAYEATLVANDSPFDRFMDGDADALGALEREGLNEFRSGASQCANCHRGAELSAAGWSVVRNRAGVFDTPAQAGFFRVGVTPITDDLGLGGKDGFGNPLFPQAPELARGTFRTPGLRNVEFTGPYFHDGSQATLEQVMDLYARNGDFPGDGNLGTGIANIQMSQADRAAVVAFLKALSDDRVRFQKSPFDHPSLCVPNGPLVQSNGQYELDGSQTGSVALDSWALVPEVGREGAGAPLQTFDELLRDIGSDGSRANTMATSCTP